MFWAGRPWMASGWRSPRHSMECGAPAPAWLLLAGEQPAEDVADRAALPTADHAAEDAAERIVSAAATSTSAGAGAGEDAAQDVAEAAAACRLCLGLLGRRRSRALGELLADIGQHDRGEDRQQLLDQIAPACAGTTERGGDGVAVVAPEKVRNEVVAFLLVDLVHVDTTVEQAAFALLRHGGFELARVDVVRLDVLRQTADECRNQRSDGVVHLALIRADFARDVLYRTLPEELAETCHYRVHLHCWLSHAGHDTSRFD